MCVAYAKHQPAHKFKVPLKSSFTEDEKHMQSDNAFARTELVAVVYGRYTMRLYIVVWHHQFLGLLI